MIGSVDADVEEAKQTTGWWGLVMEQSQYIVLGNWIHIWINGGGAGKFM